MIEYQSRSNWNNLRPIFKNQGIFDWSKNTFNRSKCWKYEFFEKLQKFMQIFWVVSRKYSFFPFHMQYFKDIVHVIMACTGHKTGTNTPLFRHNESTRLYQLILEIPYYSSWILLFGPNVKQKTKTKQKWGIVREGDTVLLKVSCHQWSLPKFINIK